MSATGGEAFIHAEPLWRVDEGGPASRLVESLDPELGDVFHPMKICYVTNEYPIDGKHAGGIATYLKTIAETLVRQGHRVDVVFCDHHLDRREKLRINGVTVHLVPLSETVVRSFYEELCARYLGLLRLLNVAAHLSSYLAISRCLADYIEEHIVADVFECQEIGFLGYFLCMNRKNVVTKLHTPFAYVSRLNRIFSLQYAFMEYYERKAVAMSTGISSPSVALAKKIARRWSIDTPISIERLPFRLNPVIHDPSRVPPYPYVLYFGRIEIRKGVLLLAKAIRRLKDEHRDVRFLFVGADTRCGRKQDKSVKQRLVKLLGPAAPRVRFMDALRHEQLYPVIENAAFVVLPSLWENFPNACLESMALGKTVVAPSGTGFAEQFRDMESGILFERKSDRDLARKIAYCLDHPEKVREIGGNARTRVEDFEAEKMAEETVRKYRETIDLAFARPAIAEPGPPVTLRWLGREVVLRALHDPGWNSHPPAPALDEDRNPEVSIVVPTFNEAEKIAGSITKLIGQRTGRSYEIIVVDSSEDATAEIVRKRFPNVVLISSPERLSCGEAKNVGMVFARGSKILFTDADIRVPSDWVERMAAHLDRFDAVGGPFLNGTPGSLTGTLGYCLEFFRVLPRRNTVDTNSGYITGGNSGYRREAIDDRRFISGIGEDIAFNHELMREGKRVAYDSDMAVLHLNKVGFRKVFSYHVALGRGGYRYRNKLGFDSLVTRRPVLAFLVPLGIVPFITLRLFRNGDFWNAFVLMMFSPLAVVLYFFWAYGYYAEAKQSTGS